ncbi:hypothetical protein PGT21_005248 [Puccinia graminis f. sp. tritici]|uniref:Uncharacterized protein n=2 Tax=Puccinia graminis f. sp. tritici TaxID=56615 RepID=E3KL94_PUCGT|nr:uncharacterized protein PGTG_11238 [Puccinia graminis f. sp. tritici CRL 75-36-700-3]EFP85069.2 hypothetical protein PGTG_11238 [Puccinia graminis f. sp. tritici CRL 75-36-700-3]KAA1064495.1 hypothetical protein PGT21_005248 [Puccinia graminis f. sp. tritici]
MSEWAEDCTTFVPSTYPSGFFTAGQSMLDRPVGSLSYKPAGLGVIETLELDFENGAGLASNCPVNSTGYGIGEVNVVRDECSCESGEKVMALHKSGRLRANPTPWTPAG